MTETGNFNDPNWAPAIRAGILRPGNHMNDTHITATKPDGKTVKTDVKNILVMEGKATLSIPTDPKVVNDLLARQQQRHI
jgi:hypothetical protein